jgi:uncharacterized protein YecT (DUF1311 family)
MIKIKLNFLIIIFIFTCFTGFSQTAKTIDSFESQHQACLDKGEFMLGCTERFYFQMDSLLNVLYKKLRSKCDSIQKENLKDEQLQWLSKRDKQFRKNQKQVHKEAKEKEYDGGEIETMILTDKNAMFVKERVIELLNSTLENYSEHTYKRKYSKSK